MKQFLVKEIRDGTEHVIRTYEKREEAEKFVTDKRDEIRKSTFRNGKYVSMFNAISERLYEEYKKGNIDARTYNDIIDNEAMQCAYEHKTFTTKDDAFDWFFEHAYKPVFELYKKDYFKYNLIGYKKYASIMMNRMKGVDINNGYDIETDENEDSLRKCAREVWEFSALPYDADYDGIIEIEEQ